MMSHSATLTWIASTDQVDSYNVYRGTNPPGNEGATPINAAPIMGLTYVDTTIVPGKYDYVVTSVKSGIESIHSNEITVSLPPAPPTGLAVSVS